MPDRYISDEHVIINVQGLRTVLREDEPQWMLRWSYKGEFGVHRYLDQAARDAMYEKLRKALMEKDNLKAQPSDNYDFAGATKAVRLFLPNLSLQDAQWLVKTLEPIMRPAEEKARC